MLSIIWNVTRQCPWNCSFCVMNACSKCDPAELTLEQKLKIAAHIDIPCRIDLSGGEIFNDSCVDDHLQVVQTLSEKAVVGRLGISSSGYGVTDEIADLLMDKVSDVEMTMDAKPYEQFKFRPAGYHEAAGKATDILEARKIPVGIQTVLTREHYNNKKILDNLYEWLCTHKVSEWSLIRYFPAGRGEKFPQLELTESENKELVQYIQNICKASGIPALDIHYLLPGTTKSSECRCVKKSIGILPDGSVTSCFWGLNTDGNIRDSIYYLGNILEEPLSSILNGDNAQFWKHSCFGECPLGKEEDLDV